MFVQIFYTHVSFCQTFAKLWPSFCQAFCQAFAKPWPSLCQAFAKPFAKPLPSRCQAFAKPLPSFCQDFVKPLPSLCQAFAKPLPSLFPAFFAKPASQLASPSRPSAATPRRDRPTLRRLASLSLWRQPAGHPTSMRTITSPRSEAGAVLAQQRSKGCL